MRLESVLVVDDDFIDRTKAETLLRAAGLRVHAVSSGIDALEAAARLRPDLILLDVMMPNMDGLETLARLRADAATRAIPVVFLTSLVTPERPSGSSATAPQVPQAPSPSRCAPPTSPSDCASSPACRLRHWSSWQLAAIATMRSTRCSAACTCEALQLDTYTAPRLEPSTTTESRAPPFWGSSCTSIERSGGGGAEDEWLTGTR